MRWLVAGGAGMLGRDAVQYLRSRGHTVTAPSRAELDVTDADACLEVARSTDVVLNCAGWTAVDDAEDSEAGAFAVNAVGAANLARAARMAGAWVVHISTDYVFDGNARKPYSEDSPLRPCSAYGRTKAAGEWAVRAEHDDHLVVRTAWLYGEHGRCFPKAIARRASQGEEFDVVDDQWGQPTWTVDVVQILVELVERRVPAGTYHVTSTGSTTWFAFAQEIVAAACLEPGTPRPVASAGYATRALRPAYSVLDHQTLREAGITPISHWRDRWRLAAGAVLG